MKAQEEGSAERSDVEFFERDGRDAGQKIVKPLILALLLGTVGVLAILGSFTYMRTASNNLVRGRVLDSSIQLASNSSIQLASNESIRLANSCPPAEYGAERDEHCRKGYDEMLKTCDKDDFNCRSDVRNIKNKCETYNQNCRDRLKRFCKFGGKTVERIASTYKQCKNVKFVHSCYYSANKEQDSRLKKCDEYFEKRINNCLANKKRLTCERWANSVWNDCTRNASNCHHEIRSKVCRAGRDMPSLEELPTCTKYKNPAPVNVPNGEKVELKSGNRYHILSVNGCQWGGRYCLKPMAKNPQQGSDGVGLYLQAVVTDCRLVSTGNTKKPNEFYIMDAHGKCKNGGKDCHPLSFGKSACPEAEWSVDYSDCVEAKLGSRYDKIPFVFDPVEGYQDQFIIRTSQGCPKGDQCDWKLADNQQNCWSKSPVVTVEELNFDYPWKLVPVP